MGSITSHLYDMNKENIREDIEKARSIVEANGSLEDLFENFPCVIEDGDELYGIVIRPVPGGLTIISYEPSFTPSKKPLIYMESIKSVRGALIETLDLLTEKLL